MNIGKLCSRAVAAVPIGSSTEEVAILMHDMRVGCVLVTDGMGSVARVVGIVTDRDIVMAQLRHAASFSQLNISDVMTASPVSVREDEDLSMVARKMRDQGFRRAPVVNVRGELVGVISIDNLISHLAKDIRLLAGVVERQR
jgi:CBS domain-containing protein